MNIPLPKRNHSVFPGTSGEPVGHLWSSPDSFFLKKPHDSISFNTHTTGNPITPRLIYTLFASILFPYLLSGQGWSNINPRLEGVKERTMMTGYYHAATCSFLFPPPHLGCCCSCCPLFYNSEREKYLSGKSPLRFFCVGTRLLQPPHSLPCKYNIFDTFPNYPPPLFTLPCDRTTPTARLTKPFLYQGKKKKRVQGDLKGNKGVSSKDIWHSSHKNVKGDRPFILFVLIPQRFKVCTHRKDNNNMNFRSVFLTAIKRRWVIS